MSDPARLYLITPVIQRPEDFASILERALDVGDVACVLLRTPPHDDGARRKVAAALVPLVQSRGAALLLEGDTRAAAAAGADGVHVLDTGDGLDQVLRSMKPSRIVGVGGLASRDDAMLAGESGVDYLLFGDAAVESEPPPLDERVERVGWWAEIFQVPCVACAYHLAEVEPLARAGAEFIALGDVVWSDARGPAAVVREVLAMLDEVALRAAEDNSEAVQ